MNIFRTPSPIPLSSLSWPLTPYPHFTTVVVNGGTGVQNSGLTTSCGKGVLRGGQKGFYSEKIYAAFIQVPDPSNQYLVPPDPRMLSPQGPGVGGQEPCKYAGEGYRDLNDGKYSISG